MNVLSPTLQLIHRVDLVFLLTLLTLLEKAFFIEYVFLIAYQFLRPLNFFINLNVQLYSAEGRFTFSSRDAGEHVVCLHSNSSAWFGGSLKLVSIFIHDDILTKSFERP